jgi:hypothetical protein
MTAGKIADASLLSKLNEAVAAANEAEKTAATAQGELVSRSKAVGLLLLEAKKLHPAVKDFDAFLKKIRGLKLSRAYDFMRLAGNRTTDEQLRQEARDRQQKSRSKKKKLPPKAPEPPGPVLDLPVTEFRDVTESNAETRRPESDPNAKQAPARALAEFTFACRTWLPKMTEADRQKARLLVLELTNNKAEAA